MNQVFRYSSRTEISEGIIKLKGEERKARVDQS